MKKICIYLLSLTAIFVLAACGGGGEDSGNTGGGSGNSGGGSSSGGGNTPQTYTQSVTVPATSGEQVVTLSNLKSSISSVGNAPSWIVISPQYYSSGAPTLKLEYQENTLTTARDCSVTILASSGDKVVLTITQQASETKSGIDDVHNDPTDQPAFSPKL